MSRISLPTVMMGNDLALPARSGLMLLALLFLVVGTTSLEIGARYWANQVTSQSTASSLAASNPTIAGLNLSLPKDQLQAKIQTVISQPASLALGGQTIAISPDTIKSWLQTTYSADQSTGYVHISAGVIARSLNDLANKYVKSPINQVTVTHDGFSKVVVGGINGAALTDPGTLTTQAKAAAKTLLDAKGLQ